MAKMQVSGWHEARERKGIRKEAVKKKRKETKRKKKKKKK